MTRDTSTTRRRALALAGAALAGTAGCTGDGGGGGGGGDDGMGGDGGNGTDGGDGGGSGGADVHGGVPSEPSDGAEVAMETEDSEHYFEPEVVWVTSGSTVTFVNESGTHSSTAYAEANDRPNRIPEDAEPWDSGTLTEEGAEFEHTFEVEGVYDYFCVPHETLEMLGTVIVGEPDTEGQPGLEEPSDELGDTVAEKLTQLNQAAEEALGGGE